MDGEVPASFARKHNRRDVGRRQRELYGLAGIGRCKKARDVGPPLPGLAPWTRLKSQFVQLFDGRLHLTLALELKRVGR
jgi:hypothetical protein